MKIHANFKAFAAVHFDASQYISSPSYGVNRFMLDRIGEEKARATTIVEYKPQSKFPHHEHIGGEEFLVLKGTFHDQHGAFPAGTYVRNPIGSQHAPWVQDDGCTIMVKLLQMSEHDHLTKPLYVHYDDELKKSSSTTTATSYGSILEMYYNEATKERVQMCWIQPNMIFPVDDYGKDGEELFVMDGSISLGDGVECYSTWAWLRFPPTNGNNDEEANAKNRPSLKSGPQGAQLYRKTGHLTERALAMEKIQIKED